jgi:hypothetical protein
MSESTFTKSVQFYVDPNGMLEFAGLLEVNDLPNCVMGAFQGAVVVDVDYNPKENIQLRHIKQLAEAGAVLHCVPLN